MYLHAYALVCDAYTAWKRGDLDGFAACLADDVEFSVPSSPRTYLGNGVGRTELRQRLSDFLDVYEVLEFNIVGAMLIATSSCDFRIRYRYRSRITRDEIEGTQRHIWSVRQGAITSFKVVHDADRLAAFFEMTAPKPSHRPTA